MHIVEIRCTMWGIADVTAVSFNDTCYGFIKSLKSWRTAHSFCEARNTSLVKFESMDELKRVANWIHNTLKLNASTRIWTAGYKRGSNWFWSTINGGKFFALL